LSLAEGHPFTFDCRAAWQSQPPRGMAELAAALARRAAGKPAG